LQNEQVGVVNMMTRGCGFVSLIFEAFPQCLSSV
jgi:hypothetical protein